MTLIMEPSRLNRTPAEKASFISSSAVARRLKCTPKRQLIAWPRSRIEGALHVGDQNQSGGAMSAKRRGRILLVEDELLLRRLIAQFLRGEGFEVVEAGDGREGVERFSSGNPFDLVLLDLNLPILPGVEVCRRIKLQRPEQPVIICSAAILDGHIAALAAMQVNQFLSKPYHPAELLSRITIELQRPVQPSAVQTERLTASTWRVDRTSPRPGPSQTLFKLPAIDSSIVPAAIAGPLENLETTDHHARSSLKQEDRFHGWETAESTGIETSERGRGAP